MDRRRRYEDAFCNNAGAEDNKFEFLEMLELQPKKKKKAVLTNLLCIHCGDKTFPTYHILDLHLLEVHDSFFQVKLERGKEKLSCLDASCKEKFLTPTQRRDHCLTYHMNLVQSMGEYLDFLRLDGQEGGESSKQSHYFDLSELTKALQ